MITWLLSVITAIIALTYQFLLHRPDLATAQTCQYVLFATVLVGSLVLVRFIGYLFIDLFFTRLTKKVPSDLLRLVVGVVSFGMAVILNLYFVLHANIAALLTTSALFTAVLGFALQATLGNLFEGLSIQVHQPFSIGDWLESDGKFGRIDSLTWRAIAVQQTDHTLASVPNNVLAQSTIRVIPDHHPFRVSIDFPAPLDIPPQRVIEAVEHAVVGAKGVSAFKRPEVLLQQFDAALSALHYELRFYTVMDEDFGRVQSQVRVRVWYALARAGIAMPAISQADGSACQMPLLQPQAAVFWPEASTFDILAANPLFADCPEDVLHVMAQRAIRLLYAPGETIDVSHTMGIVRRGLVTMPTDTEDWQVDYRDDMTDTYWSSEMLESIRQQYAEYVGPAAELLIHHAIQQTTDPYHLYRHLARDIPNAAEREAFIQAGPASPALELAVGRWFGELSLFTGQPPRGALPTAKVETELLAITVPTMRLVMAQYPERLEAIGQHLSTYYALSNDAHDQLLADMHAFYQVSAAVVNTP